MQAARLGLGKKLGMVFERRVITRGITLGDVFFFKKNEKKYLRESVVWRVFFLFHFSAWKRLWVYLELLYIGVLIYHLPWFCGKHHEVRVPTCLDHAEFSACSHLSGVSHPKGGKTPPAVPAW